MGTITVTKPEETTTDQPEWRRLCHWYAPGSDKSVCGTATAKPGQEHTLAACRARGHTICVVCSEFVENQASD